MLNTVVLMGRLTASPDVKTTQSGLSVVSFTLAVDRNYNKGDTKQTDFINCVAWRGTADFIGKYFVKGQLMAVTGALQVRGYEDKSGNKRQAVEVLVDHAHFAGSKGGNSGTSAPEGYGPPPPASYGHGGGVDVEADDKDFTPVADGEEDLPF